MDKFKLNYITLLLLLFSNNAQANAGLPVMMWISIWQSLLLIPVILIEMVVYRKRLDLRLFLCFVVSLISNIVSTLFGFGITLVDGYFESVVSDFFNIQPRLLMVLLLIPCYFISVYVEYFLLKFWIKKDNLKSVVFLANFASYVLLFCFFSASYIKYLIVNSM